MEKVNARAHANSHVQIPSDEIFCELKNPRKELRIAQHIACYRARLQQLGLSCELRIRA
jgi:hypothetical protein